MTRKTQSSSSDGAWFSTDTTYTGSATVVLSEPGITLNGRATCRFGDRTGAAVKVHITHGPENAVLRVLQSVMNQPNIVKRGEGRSRITVETTDGRFRCEDAVPSGFSTSPPDLELHCFLPRFDAKNGAPPAYWVAPLTNFTEEIAPAHLHQISDELWSHPLRLSPLAINRSDAEKLDAASLRTLVERQLLVPFEYDGSQAFLEALPDYRKRVRQLQSGRERELTTAVLVGELGRSTQGLDQLDTWFPSDLIWLLELACGNTLGIPWVELRDASGALITRIHLASSAGAFLPGHNVIPADSRRALGGFLAAAQRSKYYGEEYLRTTMVHMVWGGLHGLPPDFRLAHLFQAIDSLCTELKLKDSAAAVLSREEKRACFSAIDEAAKIIDNLAAAAEGCGLGVGDSDTNGGSISAPAALLKRAANQVRSAKNMAPSFDGALLGLLRRFDLPDAEIMMRYDAERKEAGRKPWLRLVGDCRNVTVHRGTLGLTAGLRDIAEVEPLARHLHDILVRVVLSMLGYEGSYQPTVSPAPMIVQPTWVTPEITSRQLGYEAWP